MPTLSPAMVLRLALNELHRTRVREAAASFGDADVTETACPVCRPGAVADGARAVRCILHGGGDEDVQPTNASVGGFRLAPDGAGS